MGKIAAISGWFDKSRKPITWIYCSAILFPLAFALVAALVMTARNHGGGASMPGFFQSFYLILMVLLAAVPRSVLPAVLIWLVLIRFRPALDASPLTRYPGLLVILAAALFSHAKVYDRPFNFIWLSIAALAVMLPRLALPSLRNGLRSGTLAGRAG